MNGNGTEIKQEQNGIARSVVRTVNRNFFGAYRMCVFIHVYTIYSCTAWELLDLIQSKAMSATDQKISFSMEKSRKNLLRWESNPLHIVLYILKVLDLTRKTQSRLHAEIAHASIAAVSLRAFICVYLHAFASTVRDRARARMCDCVRVSAKLYKLCPCDTGYVIVTNTVTLIRNEFRPFVACAYTIERVRACT